MTARGRVQGVGFRASTRDRARAAGLCGWVRNAADGSVEACLQGDPARIADVLDWMRAGGPPAGRVDRLETREAEVDPRAATFEVTF